MPKLKRCGIIYTCKTEQCLYLLVVRGRCGGIWSFPKGCKAPFETDEECAIRETLEETGLNVVIPKFTPSLCISGNVYFLLQTSYRLPLDVDLIKDKIEIDEVQWIGIEQLKTMNCNKDLRRFLKKSSDPFTNLNDGMVNANVET